MGGVSERECDTGARTREVLIERQVHELIQRRHGAERERAVLDREDADGAAGAHDALPLVEQAEHGRLVALCGGRVGGGRARHERHQQRREGGELRAAAELGDVLDDFGEEQRAHRRQALQHEEHRLAPVRRVVQLV